MKLKLFFLFLLCMMKPGSYAQAVVNPVPDLEQCGNDVFDLTVQVPQLLGSQDPDEFTVDFYTTEASAVAGTPAIANPQAFVAPGEETVIYARVSSLAGGTWDITMFSLIINPLPFLNGADNVVACDSYILPPLSTGNYYTGSMGTGTMLPAGTVITTTQLIYIFIQTAQMCTAEESFTIEIGILPVNNPTPLVVCDYASNGIGIFNLGLKNNEITGGYSGTFITYHATEEDALAGVNPIGNFNAYFSPSAIVYARAVSSGSGCQAVIPLTLTVAQCNNNTVSGKITFDQDNNGCTATDFPAENISIFCAGGSTTIQTFTDAEGNYSFNNLPAGTNVVTVSQNNITFSVTPSAHIVNMPGMEVSKNFCLSVPNSTTDVAVSLIPVSQARPGFPATYSLVYRNAGTTVASGTVTLAFPDDKLVFNNSAPAMVQSGNTLSFNYENLLPFQRRVISITFTVVTPPVAQSGDILVFTAAMTPIDIDSNAANNTDMVQHTLVNSYDPNDISVREGESITPDQAQGFLHYVIRFQNLGTAEAIKVRIENYLDDKLDWITFRPLASSHSYRVARRGNEVMFFFDNINLPPSSVNEPASQGYISYRIKPKADVEVGDVIENNAAVFFDFNAPVFTNTVATTVEEALFVTDNSRLAQFHVYPNPASGLFTVSLQEISEAVATITDVTGKTVQKLVLTDAQSSVDISALTHGLYFINVASEGFSVTKKIIVK
ncbi:hypothetical protein CHU92_08145 [Flavobacterium cyanobacteriorum]|uniref:Uncharacterized protein n=1 Tax=Flavobacterium cyanobacteriorum TaxID=2022802 RepID=A0A255Z7X5_9FLAO|nr:T9SS type A sorting domain-containing protein [Flavobacterium cyanobacteriorum]OYQ37549.1 hypothetical protein CHU92_08145 [Flavobacterium cyanobacteriorum]